MLEQAYRPHLVLFGYLVPSHGLLVTPSLKHSFSFFKFYFLKKANLITSFFLALMFSVWDYSFPFEAFKQIQYSCSHLLVSLKLCLDTSDSGCTTVRWRQIPLLIQSQTVNVTGQETVKAGSQRGISTYHS